MENWLVNSVFQATTNHDRGRMANSVSILASDMGYRDDCNMQEFQNGNQGKYLKQTTVRHERH